MKYHHIEGEMNDELAQKFIQFVNDNEGPIVLYLDSPGGICVSAQIIQDVINREPERFELLASNQILSCAFELFFNAKCKRVVLPEAIGADHLTGSTARVNAAGQVDDPLTAFKFAEIKRAGKRDALAFCTRLGMSQMKIETILRGKDVFFTPERLSELLQNVEDPAVN